MASFNEIVDFLSNKNNHRVVKTIIGANYKLANLIADRAHTGAKFVKEMQGGDRQNTVDMLVELALPGAREIMNKLQEDVSRIHEEAESRNAKLNKHAIRIAMEGRVHLSGLFTEVERQNISNASYIERYTNFSANLIDGKTYIVYFHEDSPKTYLYHGA
jgi:hypothetical protein